MQMKDSLQSELKRNRHQENPQREHHSCPKFAPISLSCYITDEFQHQDCKKPTACL